ncbi:MAG: zinc-dependent metalloprotease, partial [Ignavibacteriaceae bacterium]
WVNRSTRGWSYGGSVIDPRTGEIIQGRVTLGSLRVRQDYLIAEGLLAPYKKGKPVSDEMLKMSLARIRQLAAHETGHTLGLRHNFAASISDRASVMDYPHPLIKIKNDNTLDLSDAYAVGIGDWDKRAIIYGYSEFPAGINEKDALNKIIDKTISSGLMYISDEGARPLGSAHPYAHLWDNNSNPVDELNRIMKVRKIALDNFSEDNIQEGQPLANLENVLVPVYLLHRYQLEAAAKSLGGLYYTYAARGDGQKITEIVSPDQQRKALDALLNTIKPSALEIPERILKIIPPQPPGYNRTKENFVSNTGLTFDPLSAAASASELTIRLILEPQRAARLIEYNARNNACPSLSEVIDKLISASILSQQKDKNDEEIQEVVDNVVLDHLISLANSKEDLTQVNAIALFKLKNLKNHLITKIKLIKDESVISHYEYLISKINNFEKNPDIIKESKVPVVPEGQPIGSDNDFGFPAFHD